MASESMATGNMGQPAKGVGGWWLQAKEYFRDLQAEMRRVSWPTRKQVEATTGVVIVAVFLFAAYFAAVDMILGRAVNQIFQTLARR